MQINIIIEKNNAIILILIIAKKVKLIEINYDN